MERRAESAEEYAAQLILVAMAVVDEADVTMREAITARIEVVEAQFYDVLKIGRLLTPLRVWANRLEPREENFMNDTNPQTMQNEMFGEVKRTGRGPCFSVICDESLKMTYL